jgi:hypothetical protein
MMFMDLRGFAMPTLETCAAYFWALMQDVAASECADDPDVAESAVEALVSMAASVDIPAIRDRIIRTLEQIADTSRHLSARLAAWEALDSIA